MRTTAINYAQFLLNSHQNFTATFFEETVDGELSHDSVSRFLKNNKFSPAVYREKVEEIIDYSPNGILIFDDTVLDKSRGEKIELTSPMWSGQKHTIVNGIDVVTCAYHNPDTNESWLLDFRIWDKSDKRPKTRLVEDMFCLQISKRTPFSHVLADSAYSSNALINLFMDNDKLFVLGVKSNRKVSTSTSEGEALTLKHINELPWGEEEVKYGYAGVRLNEMPASRKVKLFRIAASHSGTEYVITNDGSILTTSDAQKESGCRWKIEEFHRELKQTTGVDKCQARTARSQRNHICLSMLVWLQLKLKAKLTGSNVYRVKNDPLKEFVAEQWRHPATVFEIGA